MIRSFSIILLAAAFVFGCAFLRQAGRTIKDVAEMLCVVTASEQPKAALGGMSVEDWCEIEENLRPFLDVALAAQQDAAGKAGFAQPADPVDE